MELSAGGITTVARVIVGDPTAAVTEWTSERLGGGVTEEVGLTGGLRRVSGTAHSDGRAIDWSVIVKALTHSEVAVGEYRPERDDPRAVDYWRREADAYASGLLDRLPDGISAPRCYRVDEMKGEVRLWLEDIQADDDKPWPLPRFRTAALHLGRFNGSFIGSALPVRPWLSRGRVLAWLTEGRRGIDLMHTRRRPGLLQEWLSDRSVDRIGRLHSLRAPLLAMLERLPATLCHHDAHRRNLMTSHSIGEDRTVALDWALLGTGALGEDLAVLVGVSLQFLDVSMDNVREFEAAAVDGYVVGLREAGWDGSESLLRLGYKCALSLLMGVGAAGLWFSALTDPASEGLAERIIGRPAGEIGAQWSAMQPYLLDMGEEALMQAERAA